MKIRNGFISNSSSSSFVLIANTKPQDSQYYGRTWTHKTTGKVNDDYEILHVNAFGEEENYCRGDIIWVRSIVGKIKYLMAMYAYYYQHSKNYFEKVLTLRSKIFNLGIKHWYAIGIPIPPLLARFDYDYDFETRTKKKDTKKIETYINIFTECTYIKDLVKMIEDEDTTRLDSFIFNKDSFAVLGGDEYSETAELSRRAVNYLNEIRKDNPGFSYIRFADYEDHEAGEVFYVDKDGTEHKWDYTSHWEEDCFPSEDGQYYGYDFDENDYDESMIQEM